MSDETDTLNLGDADGIAYVDVDQEDGINRVDLVVQVGDDLSPVHCEQRPPSGRYVLARVDPDDVPHGDGGSE